MNTRTVSWILAVVFVAAAWVLPTEVDAADWRVRKSCELDDSEPEVPNIVAPREANRLAIERSILEPRRIVETRRSAPTPADRSQNLLLRMLRMLRSLNLGGLAR